MTYLSEDNSSEINIPLILSGDKPTVNFKVILDSLGKNIFKFQFDILPPKNVTATNSSGNTLLNWESPDVGSPSNYLIYYKIEGPGNFQILKKLNGNITSYQTNQPYNSEETYLYSIVSEGVNGERSILSEIVTSEPLPEYYKVKIEKLGNGKGIVESKVNGINCGIDEINCNTNIMEGETIIFKAIPDTNSHLYIWGGDCSKCSDNNECKIKVSKELNCNIQFNKNQCDSSHVDLCSSETLCENYTGYWYDGNCHSEPKQNENNYNATGIIYGKIIAEEGDNVSGKLIILSDESGNFISKAISDINGKFKINYQLYLTEAKKFKLTSFLNGKELNYEFNISPGKNTFEIAKLKEKTEECITPELTIKNGWNLLGWCGEDSIPATIIGDETIKTMWKWAGSNWQIWSPNTTIMNLIANYGLQNISTIEKGEGFWVNK